MGEITQLAKENSGPAKKEKVNQIDISSEIRTLAPDKMAVSINNLGASQL